MTILQKKKLNFPWEKKWKSRKLYFHLLSLWAHRSNLSSVLRWALCTGENQELTADGSSLYLGNKYVSSLIPFTETPIHICFGSQLYLRLFYRRLNSEHLMIAVNENIIGYLSKNRLRKAIRKTTALLTLEHSSSGPLHCLQNDTAPMFPCE